VNRRRPFAAGFALSAVLLGAASGQASPAALTLREAVGIALEKNPLRKAALADTRAASADTETARAFLLPHLTFSETATRGNDPVYVFGSRLRQQRFAQSDFALNQLNRPLPLGNFATRFGGAWNLFDSFSSWRGLKRARLMEEAARHQLDRTEQEVVFHVVRTYYQAQLAAKQLEVAEQSVATAQAIVERSQARVETGLAVESDLLTAKVRLASRQQELIRARNELALALSQLNVAMGMPMESVFELSQALSEPSLPSLQLQDLESEAVSMRPDLKRIAEEASAQRETVSMAKSAFGPQLNAFAGWELDNPTLLAGGGGNNWVGGLELKIDLFQGGAKRAELSRQRALEAKTAALRQAATDGVRLDVRRAFYDLDANRQQVEVARASVAQAQESLRIHQDRYETGLITITDLLAAEEAAHRSQTDYWNSVSQLRTSYAGLELATGTLNSQSPAVMP
jgi:outer membrane protein TolC